MLPGKTLALMLPFCISPATIPSNSVIRTDLFPPGVPIAFHMKPPSYYPSHILLLPLYLPAVPSEYLRRCALFTVICNPSAQHSILHSLDIYQIFIG